VKRYAVLKVDFSSLQLQDTKQEAIRKIEGSVLRRTEKEKAISLALLMILEK
jgi:hypothetical protein